MASEDQREFGPLTTCKCDGKHDECKLMNNYSAPCKCPFYRRLEGLDNHDAIGHCDKGNEKL